MFSENNQKRVKNTNIAKLEQIDICVVSQYTPLVVSRGICALACVISYNNIVPLFLLISTSQI